jgi:antibiotic biosynthesis monooxygenase (ABM) superfamily enzyme
MKKQTVTSIVHHHIKENQMENFLDWLERIRLACGNFPGHLDSKLIDSIGNVNERISVFRFDSQENLSNWINSQEHQEFLNELPRITKDKTIIESYKGLEFWFETNPPGQLKMSIITFIAILPLVFYTAPTLMLLTPLKSGLALDIIATAVIVLLMTYLVMPLMIKLVKKIGLLD